VDRLSLQPERPGSSADRGSATRHLAWNSAFVVCFFAAYALFIPQIVRSLDPLTGDEPFYVMTAISLARDGDIQESDNYARRDYEEFYPPDPLPPGWQGWPAFPRTLPPHAGLSVRPGIYSWHGLGVPILILIPYDLGGRVAVMLLLNLVAALVALNVYLLARRYTRDWRWPAAISCALAFSNPLMSYAYLIFPEIFAALAISYAFRRGREQQNGPLQWLLVGLALALLPWLHVRFAPVALGLFIALLPGLRRERRWACRLAAIAPPVAGGLALAALNWYIYGQLTPNYGRAQSGASNYPGFNDFVGTVNGLFGLFLDEQWGLLIYTPLYLLALLAGARLWRHSRADAAALLLVVAPYILLLAWFRIWWGEWGPPARYLAPIAPLAAVPLACWVARARPALAVPAVALAALPGFAVMGGFLAAPQLMYNHPDGHSALFKAWAAQLDARTWPKVIPSFQLYSPSSGWRRFAWSLLLAALVLLPWLAPDPEPANEDAG
jgi:hypothetical protein